jgi:hypothetical protein
MKNIKIAVIFLLLLLLIYPVFSAAISGGKPNSQPGREFRGPVTLPTTNPPQDNLPSYMYKISSGLLNYIFPESRTAYYDEACSREHMIKNKAIIPADQLGAQGQSIGDIAFVEVDINSQYKPEAERFFYSISSSQSWPGQIWIWGWVSLDNVRELSKQGWVYSISMPSETACLKMPSENPTQNQTNAPSSSNYQVPAVKNPTLQMGMKYLKNAVPIKLTTSNRFSAIKMRQ